MEAIHLFFLRDFSPIEKQVEEVVLWLGRVVIWLVDKLTEIAQMVVLLFRTHILCMPKPIHTELDIVEQLPRPVSNIVYSYLLYDILRDVKGKVQDLAEPLQVQLAKSGKLVSNFDFAKIRGLGSDSLRLNQQEIERLLHFFPNVMELNLYALSEISSEQISRIAILCQGLRSLKVYLSKPRQDDFAAIAKFKELRSLRIKMFCSRDFDVSIEALRPLDQLESLSLRGNVTNTILAQLEFFPRIKYLHLCLHRDLVFSRLLNSLSQLPLLKELKPSNCRYSLPLQNYKKIKTQYPDLKISLDSESLYDPTMYCWRNLESMLKNNLL